MNPVSALGGALAALPSVPLAGAGSGGPAAAGGATGAGFADQVTGALESLNALHGQADALAQQAAVGTLQDVHDYTIAATQASLATELTVAVRNKAVESFNEIMRMQV